MKKQGRSHRLLTKVGTELQTTFLNMRSTETDDHYLEGMMDDTWDRVLERDLAADTGRLGIETTS